MACDGTNRLSFRGAVFRRFVARSSWRRGSSRAVPGTQMRATMTVECRDIDGGVRILTLNNPPANAFNRALMADLGAALDAAKHDDRVRAVVVTGAGKFFSGGLDLKEVTAQ